MRIDSRRVPMVSPRVSEDSFPRAKRQSPKRDRRRRARSGGSLEERMFRHIIAMECNHTLKHVEYSRRIDHCLGGFIGVLEKYILRNNSKVMIECDQLERLALKRRQKLDIYVPLESLQIHNVEIPSEPTHSGRTHGRLRRPLT
jgi:hypothetical protein